MINESINLTDVKCSLRGKNRGLCIVCYIIGAECYQLDLWKCVGVIRNETGEASPVAAAELKGDEANRLEQLPAGAQWELQVMKSEKSDAIAQKGSKNLSSTTPRSDDLS